MHATIPMPRTCAICRRKVDWTAVDRHRAPGALEDGVVLCRDCWQRVRQLDAA